VTEDERIREAGIRKLFEQQVREWLKRTPAERAERQRAIRYREMIKELIPIPKEHVIRENDE
jgi:hypothetical protein